MNVIQLLVFTGNVRHKYPVFGVTQTTSMEFRSSQWQSRSTPSPHVQVQRHLQGARQGRWAYEVIDISQDSDARDYVMALGYLQAPVVVRGRKHWSGFRPGPHRNLAVSTATAWSDRRHDVAVGRLLLVGVGEHAPIRREAGRVGAADPGPRPRRTSPSMKPYVLITPTYGGARSATTTAGGDMSPTRSSRFLNDPHNRSLIRA